jgi:mono/diheme cytochrome c family protein
MKGRLGPLLIVTPLILAFSAYTFAQSGEEAFKRRCAGCHGANGAGNTTIGKNLKLRDLGSPDVQKQTDEELSAIIGKGKPGRMPSFENKLTKEQIGEVVKFIRTLKR